ncbi:MAG: alpha-L-fucosidase [Christensenellales bacterium]
MITPTPAQVAWQDLEMGMFVHFGVTTFTDQEWGDGRHGPEWFAPTALDPAQWVRVARRGGLRYLVLTAKHHDGFCLWPTKTTDYSVASAPVKTDVVGAFVEACRRADMPCGLYLSPWDRHEPCYADKAAYDDFYCRQLTELMTGYGPLVEVWFDGAGSDGRAYDWARIMNIVHTHQPGAMVFNMGEPTIRWVGNEDGLAPYPCPNVVADLSEVARTGNLTARHDLWVPAECDVPIRPGRWFWHPGEDHLVRTPDNLMHLYERSVGRGAGLLLNLAPDDRGLIPQADADALAAFADNLRARLAHPLGETRGEGARFEINFPGERTVTDAVLMEDIAQGERVQAFHLEARRAGAWRTVYTGSLIGHKHLCRLDLPADALALVIDRAEDTPRLRRVVAYTGEGVDA